jgi:hypothetical protein
MGKKLLIVGRDNDAIDEALQESHGKIENYLSLENCKMELDNLEQGALEYIPKSFRRGITARVVAHESLPSAYRYCKDVGTANFEYSRNGWAFISSDRSKCFAGGKTGGVHITMTEEQAQKSHEKWMSENKITIIN